MTTKRRTITWKEIFDNPCIYCDYLNDSSVSASPCDYCKYGSRSTEIEFKLGRRFRIKNTEPGQIPETKPRAQKTKFGFLMEE